MEKAIVVGFKLAAVCGARGVRSFGAHASDIGAGSMGMANARREKGPAACCEWLMLVPR